MNRASSATGWVRNPIMKSPDLDPTQASSYALGWTWNPLSGCKHGCEYCYARTLAYGRLKKRYLENANLAVPDGVSLKHLYLKNENYRDPFYPRLWPERLDQPINYKPPCGIFVVDMGELFGDWVPHYWQAQIFEVIERCPQHRFYLLTKQPWNLELFSPFPDNCRVGASVDIYSRLGKSLHWLRQIEAKVKFLSIEPLLESFEGPQLDFEGIDQVIIGACTGKENGIKKLALRYPELTPMPLDGKWTLQPPIEWVEEIMEACDKAGVPVFQKGNLKPLLGNILRQELP